MENKNSPQANKKSSDAADNKQAEKKKNRSAASIILLLLLLLFILLLLLHLTGALSSLFGSKGEEPPVIVADTISVDPDTLPPVVVDTARVDTVLPVEVVKPPPRPVNQDSLARARALADSLARARFLADSLARALADSIARADSLRADSLAQQALADSLARADSIARALADSIAAAEVVDPCARDTIAPWVFADPSGGLHRAPVAVNLVANKDCVIEWSFDGGEWKVFDGQPIGISSQATLHFRARDACGRRMEARRRRYEFDFTDRSSQCPPDMEYVKVGGKEFCVDIYEWPNRKGVLPTAFVSLYQAMDSCFSVRKRLCSSDEWTTACSGPENSRYPYGDAFENNTCVVRDTLLQRSGSRPECRGYYGVFDMSGNLAEWTSTPSPQDRSFNNVMGGFWASGNQSRCSDARYSYFPQNRHNPVGFRCCRDALPSRDEPARRGGR